MPGADVVCVQCCKSAVRALDTVKGMVVFCELESLPMCSLHHLSMRWMVPSPGGDERQTTDEDGGWWSAVPAVVNCGVNQGY